MWQAVIPAITTILDKIIPDKGAADEAKLKTLELLQKGELAELDAQMRLALGQLEVNKTEAGGSDNYTKRWRPTIGYIIAFALGFQYIVNPLLLWANVMFNTGVEPPNIALDEHLWELILGMLGMAGWRTLDKVKGKA
jgi:hypothetical protein